MARKQYNPEEKAKLVYCQIDIYGNCTRGFYSPVDSNLG